MHRDLQNTGLIHLDLGLHLNPSRVTPAFKGSHRPAQRLKTITTTRAVQEWLLSKSAFGHHFRCCDDGETKDTRHDFRYSMMLLTRLWLGNRCQSAYQTGYLGESVALLPELSLLNPTRG
jgi:hypothetical protein